MRSVAIRHSLRIAAREIESELERRVARSVVEHPSRNGEYTGPAIVRRIPPGVSGEEVLNQKLVYLKPGEVWVRGASRVRIERVAMGVVRFRELTHGAGALRRQVVSSFIRGGSPKAMCR